jgi:hypothetical protein
MQSVFDYIVQPYDNNRYNNVKNIEGKELITNTQIFTHQNVNRVGIVLQVPRTNPLSCLDVGDEVIVHHNIFRRFHDIRGNEKNSKSYLSENKYLCRPDQIFAFKKVINWIPTPGYCFIKPIVSNDILSLDKEEPLKGIIKYLDPSFVELKKGDLVGFTPNSEYEFVINDERLYRVKTKNLTVRYEYKGKEKEYNPSWL